MQLYMRTLFLPVLGISIGGVPILLLDSEELVFPALMVRVPVCLLAGEMAEAGLLHRRSPDDLNRGQGLQDGNNEFGGQWRS